MKPLPENYLAHYARNYPDDYATYTGMVRWFGAPWPSAEFPAPICHPLAYVEQLPPNARCGYCDKPLNVDTDSGIGIPGPDGYYWYDNECELWGFRSWHEGNRG